MALIKCPECGKQISDKSPACPGCGCPREYYYSSKNEEYSYDDEEIYEEEEEDEDEEEDEELRFSLGSMWVGYRSSTKEFASLYGEYASFANKCVNEVIERYNEQSDIAAVLVWVIPFGERKIKEIIDLLIKDLYKRGIVVTMNEFEKKASAYGFDYRERCKVVNNLFAAATSYKESLDANERARQASRSRWVGGGFGVKGAIKGAVQASMLNAGTDFLRSFGDRARERENERLFSSRLRASKNNGEAFETVCYGLGICIMNAFRLYADILLSRNIISVIHLEPDKANEYFLEARRYEGKDKEQYIATMIMGLKESPGEERYYDILVPVLAEVRPNELYEFMKFWNVQTVIDKYESAILIGRVFDEEWENDPISEYWKTKKVPSEAYAKSRLFFDKFNKKHNQIEIPPLSFYGSMLINMFKNSQTTNFMTWYDVIEWIPEDISIEEFFEYIKNERYILPRCVITDAWFLGDNPEALKELNANIPSEDTLMAVVMSSDFIGNAKGIRITHDSIIDLKKPYTSIRFSEVKAVDLYDNMSIDICADNKKKITISGKDIYSENALTYFVKLMKVICVRYGNNEILWSEKMSTTKPVPGQTKAKEIEKKAEGSSCSKEDGDGSQIVADKQGYDDLVSILNNRIDSLNTEIKENGNISNPKADSFIELEESDNLKSKEMKVQCPKCGIEIPAEARFCPSCGTRL